ncbi:MAG: sensor histidine kinase [Chloroflexi bacterium]|nr:sensor histidine kinase [Chloroflexota bacterium]
MSRAGTSLDRLRPRRFDLTLVATVALMALFTVLLAADVDLRLVLFDRTLDIVVTSWSVLFAGGLALLTMPRFRDSGRLTLLLQVAAFLLSAAYGAFCVAAVLFRFDGTLGMTLGHPEQLPLYLNAVTRLLTAILFVLAGIAAINRLQTGTWRLRTVLLAPIAIVAIVGVVTYLARDLLPPLIDEVGMTELLRDTAGGGRLPGITPLAVSMVVTTVLLLIAGSLLFRTVYVTRGPVSDGFLAVALVITAFAELQAAFYPSVFTNLVTASDLMRVIAYGVILLGIGAEQRSDLRALREAYAALDRLRVTEAERAALEERARLAREIHDGLAQHLWFAKLKFERLSGSVPAEERPLAGEVGQALDSAIVEARQALVTMRTSLDTDLPLSEMLTRTVEDFGQRSGIQVTFSAGPALPAALPPRQQIEVLRVVQEALTNVRKHADATVVRVRADTHGRDLSVTVADNGKGFDPTAPIDQGLGVQGMEERARLMGGSLRITSEPQGGTMVEVTVPMLLPDWLASTAPLAAASGVTAMESSDAPARSGRTSDPLDDTTTSARVQAALSQGADPQAPRPVP